jgi:hypothetical protein
MMSKKAWVDLATTSVPTLRRFWADIAIKTETFQKICETVGITDWESSITISRAVITTVTAAG